MMQRNCAHLATLAACSVFWLASAGDLQAGAYDAAVASPEDHVGLLLRSAQESMAHIKEVVGSKEWWQQTPESREGIDEMINSITVTIEKGVKQGKDDYQAQIDNAHRGMQSAASTTDRLKGTADEIDTEHVDCRGGEQLALERAQTDLQDVKTLRADKESKCAERDAAKTFDWSLQDASPSSGGCDFKNAAHCESFGVLEDDVSALLSSIEHKKAAYREAQRRCEEAMDALDRRLSGDTLTQTLTTAEGFASKKAECDALQQRAFTSICAFGDRLQEKCKEQSDLASAVYNAKEGLATLRGQWDAAQQMRCVLTKFRDGGQLTESSDGCKGANFDQKVGPIDDKSGDKTSKGKFTCQETTISFSGQRWLTGSRSTDYTKGAYTPRVTISPVGQYPFDFCNPASA